MNTGTTFGRLRRPRLGNHFNSTLMCPAGERVRPPLSLRHSSSSLRRAHALVVPLSLPSFSPLLPSLPSSLCPNQVSIEVERDSIIVWPGLGLSQPPTSLSYPSAHMLTKPPCSVEMFEIVYCAMVLVLAPSPRLA
jgi:hypothetical protein